MGQIKAHGDGVLLLDVPHVGLIDLEVDLAPPRVQNNRVCLDHLTLRT